MNRRSFIQSLAALSLVAPRTGFAADSEFDVRRALAGKKLFIVPYSHIDWAWVHSAQWQGDRAALVIKEVLEILRGTPEYRFFVDTWNEEVERFANRAPDRVAEFCDAVARGQIAICGGTVANSHPAWMETETLVRDMILGRRLFRTIVPGFSPDIMVHYDVTPGPSQMPQILSLAGYEGYRFFRPDESLTAEAVPRIFTWIGLDGTSIPVSRGPYGGLHNAELNGFEADWDAVVSRFYETDVKNNSEPGNTNLIWVPMGADDEQPLRVALFHPPHTERPIPLLAFMRMWKQRESAPLTFATPVEFFRELKKYAENLPKHEGILDQTLWTFWYGLNGNKGLRLWRTRADQALTAAEAAASCATTVGEVYEGEIFENAWHDLLRASSHAQMWLFEQDYDRHMDCVKRALDTAQQIEDSSLQALAGRVNLPHRLNSVLLWNPLPWDRTEVIQLWLSFQHPTHTNFVVRDADGNVLRTQIIDLNYVGTSQPPRAGGVIKEAIVLVKATVPALGYTTLYFEGADGSALWPNEQQSASALDAGFCKVTFSSFGIESVFDTVARCEYPHAGNVIYNEIKDIPSSHFGPVVNTLRWEAVELPRIVTGPLRSTFEVAALIGQHHCRIVGHIFPHARRIAFETTIRSAGGSGHFMASLGLPPGGDFSADVHFGVERRDISTIQYEPPERLRKNVFYGAHWVDYAHSSGGITLIGTTGEKGYQLFPEEHALKHFLLMTIPPTHDWQRFVTPARLGTGTHKFDYQLLLHGGDWSRGAVPRRALEATHPIRPVYPNHMAPQRERMLPTRKSFVQVKPDSVLSTAVYREGKSWIVRIFESVGKPVQADVVLPFKISEAARVNFHGDHAVAVPFSGKAVSVALKPWEIVTLRVS